MKGLFCICLLFSSTLLQAQREVSYSDLLGRTKEITISDSFLVDVSTIDHILLDTTTLSLFFQSIYPPLVTKKSKPMEYYISGKITTHPNFDMLLVSTRKKSDDDTYFESVYLLTNRKDGSNINTLAVAIRRDNGAKVSTTSWLYKNYSVFVTTRINSKGQDFGGMSEYRINEDGRFVPYPHWK